MAIAKTYIEQNLKALDQRYRRSKTQKGSLFFAKLAIIELCGWVEISMDEVVLSCAKRNIKMPSNLSHIVKNVVRRTYGFEYQRHFRDMLIQVIGLANVEKIEQRLNAQIFGVFSAELETLKKARDQHAHTYLKGVLVTVDAPSITLNRFANVYRGLVDYDNAIKGLGL